MPDRTLEEAQADAVVEHLRVLHSVRYTLDPQRPEDEERLGRAPDFAFLDASGDRVGLIEITSTAEYMAKTGRQRDDFEFEANFPRFKHSIEAQFQHETSGSFTLDVPSGCRLPRNEPELSEFIRSVRRCVQDWPSGRSFQRLYWRGYEFWIVADSRDGSTLIVQAQARWTGEPKSDDLVPALEHIVGKFQEGNNVVTVGVIDCAIGRLFQT